MSGIGVQPLDGAQVPTSSQYSPQNNAFTMMQGADGAYVDQYGNQSSAPVMSFIQPRVVQRNIAITGSGAKTLSCSFQNPVMGGNSIIVCTGVGDMQDGFTSFVITDSQGNTYTKVISPPQGSTLESGIYFATGIKSGQATQNTQAVLNTITFNITGPTAVPTGIGMKIYEVWGLIASNDALDQITSGAGANSTGAQTGGFTPIAPNSIAFSSVAASKIITITPPSKWSTNDGTLFPWGGGIGAFDSQYRQLSSIANIGPSFPFSLPSNWTMVLASFRSIIVPVQGTFSPLPCANAIMSSVNASLSPVRLLGANQTRLGVSIFNSATSASGATLFVAYGVTTAKTAYVTQVVPGALWEMPQPIVQGDIYGWWNIVNGAANITELS